MESPFGRGTTLLRGLTITMVINHLLNGMILQATHVVFKAYQNCQNLSNQVIVPWKFFSRELLNLGGEESTLPETNFSPLKMMVSNRSFLFQGSIFRGKLLVSGRVSQSILAFLKEAGKMDFGIFLFEALSRWWQLKYFWNFHPEKWGFHDPI